jgi:hypothetical protein
MDNKALQKYSNVSALSRAASPEVDDEVDDLGCFGWLRGVKERSVMLELRKRAGERLAVGYSWIERIAFDPSDGIVILGAGTRITIQGTGLLAQSGASLFVGLTQHRVPWISEHHSHAVLDVPSGQCVVTRLTWA